MPQWTPLHTASRRVIVRLADQRGQALVEFAVVLPVLVAIILGIIYFGRAESDSSQQTSLAEQAARYAAVDVNPGSSGQTLQQYVASTATGDLASQVGVKLTCSAGACTTPTSGATVTACVYSQLNALGFNFPIVQRATMRIEQAQTANWTSGATTSTPPC